MASLSYIWDVRNIAKINPKWQKTAFFRLFSIFSNSPYDSIDILYSHSTPYFGPICAMSSNSYDWDSSESEGNRSKPTPSPHMRLWFILFFMFPLGFSSLMLVPLHIYETFCETFAGRRLRLLPSC